MQLTTSFQEERLKINCKLPFKVLVFFNTNIIHLSLNVWIYILFFFFFYIRVTNSHLPLASFYDQCGNTFLIIKFELFFSLLSSFLLAKKKILLPIHDLFMIHKNTHLMHFHFVLVLLMKFAQYLKWLTTTSFGPISNPF